MAPFRRLSMSVGTFRPESDGKASGPEREDRCGAEGDARPPQASDAFPRGDFHLPGEITSIG